MRVFMLLAVHPDRIGPEGDSVFLFYANLTVHVPTEETVLHDGALFLVAGTVIFHPANGTWLNLRRKSHKPPLTEGATRAWAHRRTGRAQLAHG